MSFVSQGQRQYLNPEGHGQSKHSTRLGSFEAYESLISCPAPPTRTAPPPDDESLFPYRYHKYLVMMLWQTHDGSPRSWLVKSLHFWSPSNGVVEVFKDFWSTSRYSRLPGWSLLIEVLEYRARAKVQAKVSFDWLWGDRRQRSNVHINDKKGN